MARAIPDRAMPIRIAMGRRLKAMLDRAKNSSRAMLRPHPQVARVLLSRLTMLRALPIVSQGACRVASCDADCVRKAGMTSVTSGQGAPSCWCALGAHRADRSIWRLTVAVARLSRHTLFAGGFWDRSRLLQGAGGFGLIEFRPAS